MEILCAGEFLGFVHPSGEKHIMDSNAWVACPGKRVFLGSFRPFQPKFRLGQDNPSDECTTGDVPTIFSGDLSDHDGEPLYKTTSACSRCRFFFAAGPYNGVTMGVC